jgi:putative ABC transport system permease protein
MRQLSVALGVATGSILSNKLRAGLTMLGMIIGVAAVVALLAVGKGTQEGISAQIRSIGTNVVFITPGAARQAGVAQARGSQNSLTYEDAQAIQDADFAGIDAVVPERTTNIQAVAGDQNSSTRITGTTPEYSEARNAKIDTGTFFDQSNVDNADSVVVLGPVTASDLFPNGDAIGQTIALSTNNQRITARVIGILQSKGGSGLGNSDDIILAPITTVMRKLGVTRTPRGEESISQITLELVDEAADTRAQATNDVTTLLLARHRVAQPDFQLQSQEDLITTITQVSGTFTLYMVAVAGISLVVGGIGIMNIMTVSVTQRTREIGLRKAIGATRNEILLQFLVEALMVSMLGGAIGILIGGGGAMAFTSGASRAIVTLDSILLAFGVSVGIGLFFGIYPAAQASNLNPIDALRYE